MQNGPSVLFPNTNCGFCLLLLCLFSFSPSFCFVVSLFVVSFSPLLFSLLPVTDPLRVVFDLQGGGEGVSEEERRVRQVLGDSCCSAREPEQTAHRRTENAQGALFP